MSRIASLAASLVLASVAMSSVAHAEGDRYDPKVALGLSLGTTLAGAGALVVGGARGNEWLILGGAAGVLVGPSTGHFYSHHYLTRGMGLRAGGIAVALGGLALMVNACPGGKDSPCGDSPVGDAIAIAGVLTYIGGTIDDIATAPGEARRRSGLIKDLSIAPVVTPSQAGFAIAGSF